MRKRRDRTKQMLRGIEKATAKAVTEAAEKLLAISQRAVSRKYSGRQGDR